MGNKRSDKKRAAGPSYEEGQFRDPSIEQLQDPTFDKSELDKLVEKAGVPVKRPLDPKSRNS